MFLKHLWTIMCGSQNVVKFRHIIFRKEKKISVLKNIYSEKFLKGTQRALGHLGTQTLETLGHSKGTWALRQLHTRALKEQLGPQAHRHSSFWTLEVLYLAHSFIWDLVLFRGCAICIKTYYQILGEIDTKLLRSVSRRYISSIWGLT